jgi:hypothetical protein
MEDLSNKENKVDYNKKENSFNRLSKIQNLLKEESAMRKTSK